MNLPQKTKSTKMTLSGHGSADRRADRLVIQQLTQLTQTS